MDNNKKYVKAVYLHSGYERVVKGELISDDLHTYTIFSLKLKKELVVGKANLITFKEIEAWRAEQ